MAIALCVGSDTQFLYLKHYTNTSVKRPAGRKPSNSDQTGHVNGDLRQQGLFELPHKQTVNELVRVCRTPCGKGPAPHSAPVGLILETLVLLLTLPPQEKDLVAFQKKKKGCLAAVASAVGSFGGV